MNMHEAEPKINTGRRSLLRAAPAAGLAAMMAGATAASNSDTNDTPILRMFRDHNAIEEAARKHVTGKTGDAEDEELDRLFYDRSEQLAKQIMAEPCTCAADFAAKVIVDTADGSLLSDWETGALWVEARALTGMRGMV